MTVLADTRASHVVNAPLKFIDLAQWLFSLNDQTYQGCSPAHIACGTSRTTDGKRMSINVEQIHGNLLVQHYVEEIAKPDHVRVNSLSDSYTDGRATKLEVTWELTVKPLTDDTCELSNHVVVRSTLAFMRLLEQAGVTDVTDVSGQFARDTEEHNREETPFFAGDIERKAQQGVWRTAQSPA